MITIPDYLDARDYQGSETEWLRRDLYRAYYQARQNKRTTHNQLAFEIELERNLEELVEQIVARQYVLRPGIAFVINEPKVREIFAATFRDRVIHHLVFNYIVRYWEERFIYDSYSCRPRRGTHFGIKRVNQFLLAATNQYTRLAWVMKLDIAGYFMNMRRDLVWRACQQMLADKNFRQPAPVKNILMYLLPIIIFADPTKNVHIRGSQARWETLPPDKSLFHAPPGLGFPIGNLTSQLFSNIYLNQLDQFVKRNLGMRHYGRYVDDFVLVHRDREVLVNARSRIDAFLQANLGLHLHPHKFYLQPAVHGVNFIGAKIRREKVFPTTRFDQNFATFWYTQNFQHQALGFQSAYASYAGHAWSYEKIIFSAPASVL